MITLKINPIKENVSIVKESNLRGIHTGDIHVTNSATFIVNGIVNGNIQIDKNCEVIVWGTVNGNITNAGICRIIGTVNGKLIETNGEFKIDKNALISG